jgi:hypothetical protein
MEGWHETSIANCREEDAEAGLASLEQSAPSSIDERVPLDGTYRILSQNSPNTLPFSSFHRVSFRRKKKEEVGTKKEADSKMAAKTADKVSHEFVHFVLDG